MDDVAIRAVPVLVGLVAMSAAGLVALLRLARRTAREDDKIDGLITANRARFRPGMETVDWELVNRWGLPRWHMAFRAQCRWIR